MKTILYILAFASCLLIFIGLIPRRAASMTDGVRADYLIIDFANQVEKEYGFQLSAVGGAVDNGIKLCALNFHRKGVPLNRDEARRMIFFFLEKFINEVNANEEVRPYLRDYPFSHLNVSMAIMNFNENGSDVYAPFIDIVSSNNNKISYFIQKSPKIGDFEVMRESYEEASEILRKEREQEKNILDKPSPCDDK